MKQNDYVQFTGKLPKELKGMKKPIFGKIEKKVGKTKVVVKPRYKHFEVSIAITELTEVDYKTYQAKKKVISKKITVTKKADEMLMEGNIQNKTEESIKADIEGLPKKEACPSYNWIKDIPINNTPEPTPAFDNEILKSKDKASNRAIVYGLFTLILLSLAVSIYFLF